MDGLMNNGSAMKGPRNIVSQFKTQMANTHPNFGAAFVVNQQNAQAISLAKTTLVTWRAEVRSILTRPSGPFPHFPRMCGPVLARSATKCSKSICLPSIISSSCLLVLPSLRCRGQHQVTEHHPGEPPLERNQQMGQQQVSNRVQLESHLWRATSNQQVSNRVQQAGHSQQQC